MKSENAAMIFSPTAAGALRENSHPEELRAEERIWESICTSAHATASREPLLSMRMQKLVLMRISLADSVASLLAHKLACEELCQVKLHQLILEILEADSRIMRQVANDIIAVKTRDPACMDYLHVLLNMKGFHALEIYRITHALWKTGRRELALSISNATSISLCVDIHPAAQIGSGVMVDHGSGVVIGETTVIDDDVSILQNVTLGGTGKHRGDRHPKIRSGVMIGAGATILGNIEIGSMSKVAAGSVVLTNVPSHCTVAGVPAKIVRRNFNSALPAFDMDQSVDKRM